MLPHPQATSTDHGAPRKSDLSIEIHKQPEIHFLNIPLRKKVSKQILKNARCTGVKKSSEKVFEDKVIELHFSAINFKNYV